MSVHVHFAIKVRVCDGIFANFCSRVKIPRHPFAFDVLFALSVDYLIDRRVRQMHGAVILKPFTAAISPESSEARLLLPSLYVLSR